jgi:hypothetical protein
MGSRSIILIRLPNGVIPNDRAFTSGRRDLACSEAADGPREILRSA